MLAVRGDKMVELESKSLDYVSRDDEVDLRGEIWSQGKGKL